MLELSSCDCNLSEGATSRECSMTADKSDQAEVSSLSTAVAHNPLRYGDPQLFAGCLNNPILGIVVNGGRPFCRHAVAGRMRFRLG